MPDQRNQGRPQQGATPNRGQQQRPPQTPVVLKGPPALLSRLPAVQGIHRSLETLQQAVQQASDKAFLLTPTVSPEMIPDFHEVAVRLVVVDTRDDSGDWYKPQGARGDEVALTKATLDRISGAAGISWDPLRSGRLDDASDPHYVHFRSVGYVQDLDGRRRVLVGEKSIDLRDAAVMTDDPTKMACKWVNGQRTNQIENEGYIAGWSAQRLTQAREHILAMAESKAKNRAVRSLGVKQKYRRSELEQKPFAVLALVLTGRSDDPELERMAKTRMLDVALQTSREVYGSEALPPLRERPLELPAPIATERHAPPPPDTVPAADEADEEDVRLVSEDEIQCACPDGPAGQHELGCQFQGANDARD